MSLKGLIVVKSCSISLGYTVGTGGLFCAWQNILGWLEAVKMVT